MLVGPDRTCFKLHKDLLCDKSVYFEARLKDCWDGTKPKIDLPDISLAHFEIIVDWLYTGRIPDHFLKVDESTNRPPLWSMIEALYKAADTLMLTEFQNKLVDLDLADSRKSGSTWWLESLAKHHEMELTHTPFYKMVLRSSVKHFVENPRSEDDFESVLSSLVNYPQGSIDILREINLFNRKPWPPVHQEDKCEFHIHVDEQKC